VSIVLDDNLAEEALVAASIAGSKGLVEGLLKAGVRAGSAFGAALVMAEFNGFHDVAKVLREKMKEENAKIPDWRSPNFILSP